MTNDQFEALVQRLEQQAIHAPQAYKAKVVTLALLGNAYILAILFVLLLVILGLCASILVLKYLAIKLILVVGYFLWRAIKAMWVKIDLPDGQVLQQADAPALFALLEDLSQQLGAARFHKVQVTDEFNASVIQLPRLGIFGFYRNYLQIGLPLMKSLSVDQFKVVLAHELGHLQRGHGRMSSWIYRQRLRWIRLHNELEATESRGGFLFQPFLNRFVPYFMAYSFPMARANEYEADATAAQLTSPDISAQALTSVNVIGCFLSETYWPQIHKQAAEQPYPNFTPFQGLTHGVGTQLDSAAAQDWLKKTLAHQTSSDDTHPALQDRLNALGANPELALPAVNHTADQLLEPALNRLTNYFDQSWRDAIAPAWEKHYEESQKSRQRLAELQAKGYESCSLQEAYELATLTEDVADDADSALAQFRALHEREPDDAWLCWALGARLLLRDQDEGSELLERAMQLDEMTILRSSEALANYYWRNDREQEAEHWRQVYLERNTLENAASQERNEVTLKDQFDYHDLPEEQIQEIRAALTEIYGIRKVYLLKKRVKHMPHLPCYVLGFTTAAWYQLHSKERTQQVLARIKTSVPFPGETLILSVDGGNYRFGRKFHWKSRSRII